MSIEDQLSTLLYAAPNASKELFDRTPAFSANKVRSFVEYTKAKGAEGKGALSAEGRKAAHDLAVVLEGLRNVFLDKAAPHTSLAVRDALVKVVDKNFDDSGAPKFKSAAEFTADLNKAQEKASNAAHEVTAESEMLSIAAKNPAIYHPFDAVPQGAPSYVEVASKAGIVKAANDLTAAKLALVSMAAGVGISFDEQSPSSVASALKKGSAEEKKSLADKISEFETARNAFEQHVDSLSTAATFSALSDVQAEDSRLKSKLPNLNFYFEKLRADTSVDISLRAVAAALLDTEISASVIAKMLTKNVAVPLNIVLARPWIWLKMRSAVLAMSGYDLGVTTYGNTNFALGGDAAAKRIQGSFTFYLAAHVLTKKALQHIKGVIPSGYVGGWNAEFFDDIRHDQLMDELQQTTRERPSLLALAVPITETPEYARLSLVPLQHRTSSVSATSNPFQTTVSDRYSLFKEYSSAPYYNQFLELDDTSSPVARGTSFDDEVAMHNTVMYEGKHVTYSSVNNRFDEWHLSGVGHLSGNRTGPGCDKVWRGSQGMFPVQHDRQIFFS